VESTLQQLVWYGRQSNQYSVRSTPYMPQNFSNHRVDLSPIPLYHTSSSCVIRGRKWLCHTVYDKTKVFFGASYPVTSTANPCICIRSQKTVPNNLVGRCRHNHTTITPVHAHQKIPLFYHKTYDTTIYFSETKKNVFPYWNSEYHTLYHTLNELGGT